VYALSPDLCAIDSMSAIPTTDADQDRPVAVLLQTATFAELKKVEQRTRFEVEAKQNDLRQLVGESYKDLIESANSVLHMCNSCAQVESVLKSTNDLMNSEPFNSPDLQDDSQIPAVDEPTPEEAVQDKLASVVAAPECIWRALEQKQVSVAASSYLAARDTYHSLSEAAKHASSLPLANAWQVLQELHLQIQHTAFAVLMVPFSAWSTYSDALSAVKWLDGEGSNADGTTTFDLFLESRTAWLEHFVQLSRTQSESAVQHASHIVSETIRVLQSTAYDAVGIFSLEDDCGEQLSDSLKGTLKMDEAAMHAKLPQWLRNATRIVCTQIAVVLEQVSEGQVLSKLQQVAIKAVADPQFCPVGSLTWSDAAKFTTSAPEGGYDFSKLWAEFLDPVFEQRARSVISLGFDRLDTASHLGNAAEKLHDTQNTISIGVTVQQVCSAITSQMQAVLLDVHSLFRVGVEEASAEQSSSEARLADFFQNRCCEHLEELATSAISRLEELQAAGNSSINHKSDSGSVDAVKSTIVDEALLLGGVCGALADGANELLASVSPNQDASSLVKQGAQEQLQQCHISAYSLWVKWTVAAYGHQLRHNFCASDWPLRDFETHYEEISNNGDVGKDGASRLPAHLSTPTLQFLHQLCQQAIRIGANAADNTVKQMLQKGTFDGAIECYQEVLKQNQDCGKFALQCIFDLKFLQHLLIEPGNSTHLQKSHSLINSFQSYVDPIEYEIYDSLLNKAVQKAYQRLSILLGPLAGQHCSRFDPGSTSLTDVPNLLKLAPVFGRFTLLATHMFPPPPAFAMKENWDTSPTAMSTANVDNLPTPKGMVETLSSQVGFFERARGLSQGVSGLFG